jgi:hypothetical protein
VADLKNLLEPIITDTQRYGLSQRHLNKHRTDSCPIL